MGEIEAIQRLVRSSPQLSDDACLAVIDPPYHDRDRESLMPATEGRSTRANAQYWMPRLEAWRASLDVGVVLDNNTQIIRTNYFRMNPSRVPPIIYHYNISIFRYDKEMQIGSEDLSKSNDKQSNTGIIKYLVDSKSNWRLASGNDKIGLAYDGKSSMYATHHLPSFTDQEHFQQDVIYPPGSNTTYSVMITLAGEIHPPHTQREFMLLSIF